MNRLAATFALAGLTLAACGGDDDAAITPTVSAPVTTELAVADSAVTEPTAGEPSTHMPVTIEHIYGDTVVEGLPDRIVSLDMQWTDVLTALGHPPVASVTDPTVGGWFPWQQTDGIEPIEIGAGGSIPYETAATYQPDLIVGSWGVADQDAYDLLSAIAPTIPLLGDRDVDPWEEMAAVAGEIFGESEAVAALLAAADQAAADLLAEFPGLDGKTYALANYIPGDQIYVVADPDDGASQVFAKLGMEIDPELLELDGAGFGRVEVSLENIGALDSDLVMILTNGADPADIAGFDALPAVQAGAVSVMEYAPVVGLNTPTPLSIPYSLNYIRSALAAAATG